MPGDRWLGGNDSDGGLRRAIVSEIRPNRDGLAHVLSELDDVTQLATYDTATAYVGLAVRVSPHVIHLDMTETSSASAARLFARKLPEPSIVAIAVSETEPCVRACVEAGVTGYVSREASKWDVVDHGDVLKIVHPVSNQVPESPPNPPRRRDLVDGRRDHPGRASRVHRC